MGLNILVVDDSAVMRSMIAKAVGLSGIDLQAIHQAANGKEGLACLAEHWIDVVITDLNMPEMNGEEMIDRMLEDPAHRGVPVIVISTEGSSRRIERLVKKGAWFIRKPFTPEKVRDVLVQVVGKAVIDGREGGRPAVGGDD